MKQNYFCWLILLLLAAGCTPKGLAKTTQDFKEELTNSRLQYKYEKDVFQGEGTILILAASMDSTAQQFDVTASLNNYLDKEEIIVCTMIKIECGEGCRIQIYRGKSRSEAEKAKQRFYELFPRVATYFIYSSPNYRVNVGDFLDADDDECINIYNRLKIDFPDALVIPDIINEPGSTYKNRKKQ